MDLELSIDLNEVDETKHINFCKYIIIQIKNYIESNCDENKINTKLESYINENIKWDSKNKIFISIKSILLECCDNLIYKKQEINNNKYLITLNNNSKLDNSNTTLNSLLKLITYGSLSVRGYTLFSDTLKFIADNINTYYNIFITGA